MTTKQWANLLSIIVGAAIAGIGAILALDPGSLGLDPIFVRWLGIANVILGYLATQTHRVSSEPKVGAETEDKTQGVQ